jgi:hypothetical protein
MLDGRRAETTPLYSDHQADTSAAAKARWNQIEHVISAGTEFERRGRNRDNNSRTRSRASVRGLSTAHMEEDKARHGKKKGGLCACASRATPPPEGSPAPQAEVQLDESAIDAVKLDAVSKGLTEPEAEIAIEIFYLATNSNPSMSPDGLKELMRWFSFSLELHQLRNVLIDIRHQSHLADGITLDRVDADSQVRASWS